MTKAGEIIPGGYASLLAEVRERVQAEQYAALPAEFPGVSGFSSSNLWRMKAFYEAYGGSEKLAPLVREIAWSHNLIVLERCTDPLEREFYLRMTGNHGGEES